MIELQRIRKQLEGMPAKEELLWTITCLEDAMCSLSELTAAVELGATLEELSKMLNKAWGRLLLSTTYGPSLAKQGD